MLPSWKGKSVLILATGPRHDGPHPLGRRTKVFQKRPKRKRVRLGCVLDTALGATVEWGTPFSLRIARETPTQRVVSRLATQREPTLERFSELESSFEEPRADRSRASLERARCSSPGSRRLWVNITIKVNKSFG